jgi:hypothetical protein
MIRSATVGALWCCALLSGCASRTGGQFTPKEDLTFLTRDGCAATDTMRGNLDAALKAMRLPTDYRVIDVDTLPESDPRGGYGTPTVLLKGRDLFGMPTPPVPHPPAT